MGAGNFSSLQKMWFITALIKVILAKLANSIFITTDRYLIDFYGNLIVSLLLIAEIINSDLQENVANYDFELH